MKRIKLLHCGDFHLDAPFTSLADHEGLPDLRRRELKRALCSAVDIAEAEKVDLMLVCGDLYEHGYAKRNTFLYICEQFRRIRNIPVLIIPGNHDPLVSDSFYSDPGWPENVTILNSGSVYEHKAAGTRVFGAVKPLEPQKTAVMSQGVNILMLHGTIDMPFSVDAFHPVSSRELDAAGFDYCAFGHFHSIIWGAGERKRIFNAGSPEPLGFDEEGEHGVFVVTIEKEDGCESRLDVAFRRIGKRRFFKLEVQADGCRTDEQAAAAIAKAVESAGGADDIYRVELKGYTDRSYKADTANIAHLLKDKACYIKIFDNTTPNYDFESIANETGLKGLFVKKMLDRAARAQDEDSRKLVMDALYYGLEAIDEGSVCV